MAEQLPNTTPDGLIHGVPGMPVPEVQPPKVTGELQPRDPSKVIGHPSNPFTNAGAAYGEFMQSQQEAPTGPAAEVGETMLEGAGVTDPSNVVQSQDVPKR
ncbi:hypothetical protein KDA23_02100 [Candidatus Saccharibacteria bacterium]|nr:hypothetical protein [Candidatus Saccharibacteria bacterium]